MKVVMTISEESYFDPWDFQSISDMNWYIKSKLFKILRNEYDKNPHDVLFNQIRRYGALTLEVWRSDVYYSDDGGIPYDRIKISWPKLKSLMGLKKSAY